MSAPKCGVNGPWSAHEQNEKHNDIAEDKHIAEHNHLAEDHHILDAATAFRAGKPGLPEVLDRPTQHRPKATSYIDKNSGIANETVRMGDSGRGFKGPELTA
jgi:hypothetical protein